MDHGKLEFGAELKDLALKELGEGCVEPADYERFCRLSLQRVSAPEEAVAFLRALNTVGIRPKPSVVWQAMPALMGPNKDVPLLDAISKVKDLTEVFSWNVLLNNSLLYLLNEETPEDFSEVVSFLTHLPTRLILKPLVWNASLARAFLATNDLDGLVSTLYVAGIHIRYSKYI